MVQRSWSQIAVPSSVPELRTAVCAFADDEGVLDPPLADIRLAVSEAITNAVIHGYRDDSGPGDVEVAATVWSDHVEVVVTDHGGGFAARADSPGAGMGMILIGAVTEHLAILDARPRGTEIKMRFRRS